MTTIGFLVRTGRYGIADGLRAAHPEVEFLVADSIDALRPALGRMDALIVATPLYSPAVADLLRNEAPRLRWMQTLSSGVDSVLKHGLPAQLTLTSAIGAHAAPVADHAMALLLALFRGVPSIALGQARRQWAQAGQRAGLREIEGCRAAMLGYGHIGRGIVRRLQAFGATVTAVNRTGQGAGEAERLLPVSALSDALVGADILMLCLPGEAASRPLVDGPALDLLAPGAVVVNVGRGSSLDTAALVERLRSGHLAGAALDVFEYEPLAPDDPLWTEPGLIVSPHLAGNGDGVAARIEALIADNLQRFLNGDALRNRVAR